MRMLSMAAAVVLFAGSAANGATVVFAGGSGTLKTGSTVITDFDTEANSAGAVFQAGSNGQGALPEFGEGSDRYLAVIGGGSYSVAFKSAKEFSFDLGSLDTYNTLILSFANGGTQTFVGGEIRGLGQIFANSGNQNIASTNGRVSFTGGAGELINGATFQSSQNSFEVDRLATIGAVPEPGTWAMMFLGFGITGAAMRSRRKAGQSALAA